MGEIERKEVEKLGRALASRYGRHWATMPTQRQGEADPNSSRKTWLERAQVILEAIDKAMILEIKRDFAKHTGSEHPQSFEPQPGEDGNPRKRDRARHGSEENKGQAREGWGSPRLRLIHKSDTSNVSTVRRRQARPDVPLRAITDEDAGEGETEKGRTKNGTIYDHDETVDRERQG